MKIEEVKPTGAWMLQAVDKALDKGASFSPSSLLLSPGHPPSMTQHTSSSGYREPGKGGNSGSKEAELTPPFSPPLSVICRLGFPITSEELRSVGSHSPGQVGQVAWVFGQGHDVIPLGPILFGFSVFICRP